MKTLCKKASVMSLVFMVSVIVSSFVASALEIDNVVTGIVAEDLTIEVPTLILGTVKGDVTVAEGAILQLDGIVMGNLIILPEAQVFLNGVVEGNVINRGGILENQGIIKGEILEETVPPQE